jgi:hypothetical protein
MVRGLMTLLVAAATVAACGGHNGSSSSATSGATPKVPLSIDSPEAGTVLKPTRVSPSRVEVTVDLAGHADSSTPVRLDAGCQARFCSAAFFSDGAGEWTRRMQLRLPSSRRLLVITASAPAAEGVTPIRLTLRVDRAARPAPATRRRSGSRPAPTTSTPPPAIPPASSTSTPGVPAPPETQPPPATPTQPTPSSGRNSGALVMIGDSLAVGVRSLLPGLLPGWQVSVNGRVSRPLAEGITILSDTPIASDGTSVLAMSLFTNDDPTHTAQLQAAVKQTLERAGANGCVIWATIARPPVNGVTYDAANSLLRRLARSDSRLRIVPWAEQTAARPSLLGPDGVHPTPAGYQLRARLYAQAAESC